MEYIETDVLRPAAGEIKGRVVSHHWGGWTGLLVYFFFFLFVCFF